MATEYLVSQLLEYTAPETGEPVRPLAANILDPVIPILNESELLKDHEIGSSILHRRLQKNLRLRILCFVRFSANCF